MLNCLGIATSNVFTPSDSSFATLIFVPSESLIMTRTHGDDTGGRYNGGGGGLLRSWTESFLRHVNLKNVAPSDIFLPYGLKVNLFAAIYIQ